MKQISIIILVFLCSYYTNAQDTISQKKGKIIAAIKAEPLSSQNPRNIFPLGINGGFMFVNNFGMFSGSIDYLITPNISAEINYRSFVLSPYFMYSFGGKYWFVNNYSKSGFSPFLGLLYCNKWMMDDAKWFSYNYVEVPIGISYITKFGFQTSLQLNSFLTYKYDRFYASEFIEFRIGWRFKTGKKN